MPFYLRDRDISSDTCLHLPLVTHRPSGAARRHVDRHASLTASAHRGFGSPPLTAQALSEARNAAT